MKKSLIFLLLIAGACFPALRAGSKPGPFVQVEAHITSVIVSLGDKGDGDPAFRLEMEVQSPATDQGLILKRIFARNGDELKTEAGFLEKGDLVTFRLKRKTLSKVNETGMTTLLKDLPGFTVLKKSSSSSEHTVLKAKAADRFAKEKNRSASDKVPWEKPAEWNAPAAATGTSGNGK